MKMVLKSKEAYRYYNPQAEKMESGLDEEELNIKDSINPLFWIYGKEIGKYKIFTKEEEREHAKKMHETLEDIARLIFSQSEFSSKYFRMIFNGSKRLDSFRELMPDRKYKNGKNSTKKYLEEILKEASDKDGVKKAKNGDPEFIMTLIRANHEQTHLRNIYNDIKFVEEKIINSKDKGKRISMLKEVGFKSAEDMGDFLDILENNFRDYKKLFDEFVNHNYRWVIKIANRYRNKRMETMDLIQEGSMGLIKAAEKFDYRKDYKFSSYSVWWIHRSIIRAIGEKSREIRIPIYLHGKIAEVLKTEKKITQEKGREATPDEIAERLDMSIKEIGELLKRVETPLSLYKALEKNNETDLIGAIENNNALSPEKSAMDAGIGEIIECAFRALNNREEKIIRLRYGIGEDREYTLEEIGESFGICRERIRQIEKNAIRKLKNGKLSLLKPYYTNKHARKTQPEMISLTKVLRGYIPEEYKEMDYNKTRSYFATLRRHLRIGNPRLYNEMKIIGRFYFLPKDKIIEVHKTLKEKRFKQYSKNKDYAQKDLHAQ